MKKISLFAAATDSALAAACAFVLIFTAVRHYTDNAALGLGLGIAAFALFGALAFFRLTSKRGKACAFGKKQARRQAEKLYLCTLTKSAQVGLLAAATGGKATGAGAFKDGATYMPVFCPEMLSPNDICGATAKKCEGKKIIVCNGATDEAKRFAAFAGAEIINSDEILDKLEELHALPEELSKKNGTKAGIKQKFASLLMRKNASRLMWCGLWLTAFSYFTFFPSYYIAAGGVMLSLAAVCLIFGKRG